MPALSVVARAILAVAAFTAVATAAVAPTPPQTNQTNLPPPPDGLFESYTRAAISAPIDTVWAAMVDFPSYPNWNPFVRSAVLANELFIPLPSDEQTVVENKRVIFQTQIPPLALPVTNSTAPDLLNAQISFENITHVDEALGRAAWRQLDFPKVALDSERWSAVSVITDGPDAGKVLYESRMVYAGALAPILQLLYETALQESFDAQAVAMQDLLEGQSA